MVLCYPTLLHKPSSHLQTSSSSPLNSKRMTGATILFICFALTIPSSVQSKREPSSSVAFYPLYPIHHPTPSSVPSVHPTINSAQVLPWLRAIVELIGESILGFSKDDIGLHSIRSGGAMAMFLAGISTVILRRIGRWSSEAFLEYIREQVESFTYGVAQRMLSHKHFFTLNHAGEPTSASSTIPLISKTSL